MKIKTVLKKSYGKTYSLDDIDDIIKTISEKVEKPIKKLRKSFLNMLKLKMILYRLMLPKVVI